VGHSANAGANANQDNSKKREPRRDAKREGPAVKGEGSVERVCFLARVRPDRLDEYRERHKSVWPQMRAALSRAGWGNYSIFLADDGLLVGYLETEDYQAALDAMAGTAVNERWQGEMSEFFVADGPPDQSFTRLTEIFHLQ
jgi:L-rhamnose mutarotase